jgi:hypothetical protein
MRIEWNNLAPVMPVNPVASRGQLNPDAEQASALGQAAADAIQNALTSTNLTQDALRAALLQLGIAADPESMELAEAFARLGLPLTDANMLEGRAIMARYPKLPAAAYGLAKLLDAPLTPGIMRALARVIDGALANSPLPDSVLNNLSLALDGGAAPAAVAKELYQIISRLGQSSEQRLAQSNDGDDILQNMLRGDPRTQLLAIASDAIDRDLRASADAHAAHIEGQQILNQINLKRFDPPVPLYFSFPVKISANAIVPAEVQVWSKDDDADDHAGSEEFGESKLVLQTIIRLSPPKLGAIEVRLSGAHNATLNCQVLVERPNAYRLLRRYTGDLAGGLSGAGWNVKDVVVGMAPEFAPLWYGGAALNHPRSRVDKKA